MTERTPEEKHAFLLSATPWKIVEEYPREYTIQMRWGAYMWHTSAVRRSDLEVKMYDLACESREYEGAISDTVGDLRRSVNAHGTTAHTTPVPAVTA